MRKLFLAFVLTICLAFAFGGCTAEWYKHDTVYKTNDHMTFSWWGYKDPAPEDWENQEAQGGWWGEPIPYVPAE